MENPLKFLFKKADTSAIGIDIGSSSIKIVQLKRKSGKAILETYGALALGPYAGLETGRATNLPSEKIAEALNDILREANTTTRQCAVALPFRSSLITVLELPTQSMKQFGQMIPIEARKYIPVPITEVTLDWTIIPKEQNSPDDSDGRDLDQINQSGQKLSTPSVPKSDVLVVALHNETINSYKEIISKTNLQTGFFEVELFSTMRSVLDQEVAPIAIFDMGAASTKLYVVERGIVKVSHTINRGSQDITLSVSQATGMSIERVETLKRTNGLLPAKAVNENIKDIAVLVLDFILSETNRVLLGYQKKYRKNIKKIVLVGGGCALKGFMQVVQENLQTPVVLGDPFSKVQTPAFLEDILRNTGPEFAVAVGIALRKLQELE